MNKLQVGGRMHRQTKEKDTKTCRYDPNLSRDENARSSCPLTVICAIVAPSLVGEAGPGLNEREP